MLKMGFVVILMTELHQYFIK